MVQPDFQISADARQLTLSTPDGRSLAVSAATLWAHCPSAFSRRARIDGRQGNPPVDLTIVRIAAIGNYAANIAFSDGRDRGIYPWHLLEELATLPQAADFIDAA
jgi:DUF971 family protein